MILKIVMSLAYLLLISIDKSQIVPIEKERGSHWVISEYEVKSAYIHEISFS